MAYYDSRPPYSHQDRYPPADYPEPPPYHHGGSAYSGSRQPSDAIAPANPSGGTRDSYYRNHPAKDAYEYGSDYPRHSRRSHKGHKSRSVEGYYDDPYDYEPRSRRSRHHDERRGREKHAYSPSPSRSPPRRQRSLSERALGALGIGSAAAATKHHDSGRGRSRGRDRRSYSYSPSPPRGSRRHREKSEQRIAQAIKAALTAGAVEAFRARKEPGEWSGPKGKRVLTAALTAGGTDGLIGRDSDKHSKRHIIESTLAGLATNRVVNGPRSRSRSHRRSRSHGRSKTKDAAIMGLLATAGKEAYSRYQKSQSQSRPRHRSSSRDSYDDDYDSRPRTSKKRSKSVSDYVNKGIAALGLSDKIEKSDKYDKDDRRRHRHHRSSRYDDYSDDDRYSDDEYYRRQPSPPRTRHSRDVSRPYYIPASGARGDEGNRRRSDVGSYHPRPDSQTTRDQPRGSKQNGSDADDSTDERTKLKRLNRETLWATSLAAAASIHAAHSLNENMEKHKERTKQIKEGEITRDEARRRKRKNQLSDAASVGVAALSIKSAALEWKNFDSKRRERAQLHKSCKERSKSLGRRGRSDSRPQHTQSLNHGAPRTVYPDEIEENWDTPDYRSRSIGRSPSVAV
ncbi:hypothetical protein BDW59DRAFT_139725 [Aspergillus cavernicola]|uniref:DUF3824 domain-containing protein n=1 Tax=Aspergillus cavernicola TaxID=176166 RepID=A0ABR4IWG5_9EURO